MKPINLACVDQLDWKEFSTKCTTKKAVICHLSSMPFIYTCLDPFSAIVQFEAATKCDRA